MKHPKFYIALVLVITLTMVAISTQVGAAPLSTECSVGYTTMEGMYGTVYVSPGYWTKGAGGYTYILITFPDRVIQAGDYFWIDASTNGSSAAIYIQASDSVWPGYETIGGVVGGSFGMPGIRANKIDVPDSVIGLHLESIVVSVGGSNSNFYLPEGGVISFNGYGACEPATPTPTTAPIATDIPQGSLPCITATVAATPTIQATMTPYGRDTATPAPSRTPGGPSPTPSPSATPYTYTAHVANSYDSGLITFEQNVSALSAVGGVNQSETPYKFLRWSGVTGYDGHPGAAWMHTDVGYAGPTVPVTMATMVNEAGIVAFYKPGGGEFFGPIAVSLYARAAYTIESNMAHWVRVWYLDPNYDGAGTAAWFSQWNEYDTTIPVGTYVGGLKVSNTWRQFGAVISPTMGSGRVTAIGFDDYWSYTDGPAGDVTGPCQDYGCVYLDDVRIAYGDAAGMVLPICNPDGTSGVAGSPTTYKMCVINSTPVDMFATCTAPTGVDLGGWLSYLWCNTSHYFGFFTANRDQVDAIIARQSVNEPFGSMSETGYITDDFNTKISVLQTENKTQAQTPIDWARMMLDGSALDRPAHFAVPDMSVAQDYMRSCPSEAMFSSSTASGACMALYMMRQTIIVTFFQWFLNALFVVGILMLIRGDLEKLAS